MTGPVPPPLSGAVVRALAALEPSDELSSALSPASRSPGSLHHLWAPVTEVRLRLMTGFRPPRLTARGVAGRREVLTVTGWNGEPTVAVGLDGRPSTSLFAVFYLPPVLDWRRAGVSSALDADVTGIYVHEADDRPWPQSVVHRRSLPERGGVRGRDEVGGDFAVVEVDGAQVGVQVDRSGAVCVGWSLRTPAQGSGRSWNVTMHTRGPAVEAVRSVQEAGLLA